MDKYLIKKQTSPSAPIDLTKEESAAAAAAAAAAAPAAAPADAAAAAPAASAKRPLPEPVAPPVGFTQSRIISIGNAEYVDSHFAVTSENDKVWIAGAEILSLPNPPFAGTKGEVLKGDKHPVSIGSLTGAKYCSEDFCFIKDPLRLVAVVRVAQGGMAVRSLALQDTAAQPVQAALETPVGPAEKVVALEPMRDGSLVLLTDAQVIVFTLAADGASASVVEAWKLPEVPIKASCVGWRREGALCIAYGISGGSVVVYTPSTRVRKASQCHYTRRKTDKARVYRIQGWFAFDDATDPFIASVGSDQHLSLFHPLKQSSFEGEFCKVGKKDQRLDVLAVHDGLGMAFVSSSYDKRGVLVDLKEGKAVKAFASLGEGRAGIFLAAFLDNGTIVYSHSNNRMDPTTRMIIPKPVTKKAAKKPAKKAKKA